MTDNYEEVSQTLARLGLDPIGFSRSEEFHVAMGQIGAEAIARIEELMEGEMPSEFKDLIHLVIERAGHKTGPQLTIEVC
jgi:hypothetical protein